VSNIIHQNGAGGRDYLRKEGKRLTKTGRKPHVCPSSVKDKPQGSIKAKRLEERGGQMKGDKKTGTILEVKPVARDRIN